MWIRHKDTRVYRPDPQTNKHFSWVGCVNAAGNAFTPMLIVQGTRHMAGFNKGWPECHVAMDAAGYMNESIFLRWVTVWEEETRNLAAGRPRCLFLDNHYSHHVVAAMTYLRDHNVRVVGMHPHTTHVLCALDCGVFRSFKQQFERALIDLVHTCTEYDICGLIKTAWGETCKVTFNPISKERKGVVIHAFEKVGLFPFDRDVLDSTEYALSDHYIKQKEKLEKAGGPAAHAEPNPKRRRLKLSDEELEKMLAAQLEPTSSFPATVASVKKAPRTQMSQLLTDPDVIKIMADKKIALQVKAEDHANKPWVKEGITWKAWCARKAAAAAEAKKAAMEAKAAKMALKAAPVAAPPPLPPPPPPVPLPKKVRKPAAPAPAAAPPPQVVDRGEGKRAEKRKRMADV